MTKKDQRQDGSKKKQGVRKISLTYLFDFEKDRRAYLGFVNYLSQLGCPSDIIREFVQTGKGTWFAKDGEVKVTKIAQVVEPQ